MNHGQHHHHDRHQKQPQTEEYVGHYDHQQQRRATTMTTFCFAKFVPLFVNLVLPQLEKICQAVRVLPELA